jgi:hypothetical protein
MGERILNGRVEKAASERVKQTSPGAPRREGAAELRKVHSIYERMSGPREPEAE